MNTEQLIFVDAARMTWSLSTCKSLGHLVLEPNYEPAGICIVATKGQITLDETNKLSPFVLELDDCVSVSLTDESATKVDEFLQAHWHTQTGVAA